MHHIFTHRMFGVSISAFLGIILLGTVGKADYISRTAYVAHLVKTSVMMIVVSVISIFLFYQLRDEYGIHNGGENFVTVTLEEPVSMAFIPMYPEVISVNVGISAAVDSGSRCNLQLWEQDSMLDQIQFAVDDGNHFHLLPVDWHLKAGQVYTLVIAPAGESKETSLWLTENDIMPLAEYGEMVTGGEKLKGQMLAGITYWCAPVQRSAQLLFISVFMGVCLMLVYSFRSVFSTQKSGLCLINYFKNNNNGKV